MLVFKYRKKPVVIEAFKLKPGSEAGRGYWPLWFDDAIGRGVIEIVGSKTPFTKAIISTLEGEMTASTGDYIILGIKSEIYPCKPDIFEATYEEV